MTMFEVETIKEYQRFLNKLHPIGIIKVSGRLDEDTINFSEELDMPFVTWFRMSKEEREAYIKNKK